ncbi:DUF5686 family protein [candidate division KSB1 bacterium]
MRNNLSKKVLQASFVLVITIFANEPTVMAQNKAPELVKEVQARIDSLYKSIESIIFSGHAKIYIYVGSDNLGLNVVPNLQEYYFTGMWMKPDSLRLVVNAFRFVDETRDSVRIELHNDTPPPNPMDFSYDAMIFGLDNQKIKTKDGTWISTDIFRPVFPFASGADSLYQYEIISEIGFGFRKIIEVQVKPKNSEIPGVIGIFRVDADLNEIVGSTYTFSEAAHFYKRAVDIQGLYPWYVKPFFHPAEDYQINTKKVLVNEVYWFPETVNEEMSIKLPGINMYLTRDLEFTSYFVNMSPEDVPLDVDFSEIPNQEVVFKRDTVFEKSVLDGSSGPSKLTDEEKQLFAEIAEGKIFLKELESEIFDSEAVANNALKMSLGQSGTRYFDQARALGEEFFLYNRYNRIEGFRLFYNIGLNNVLSQDSYFSLGGGYGFSDKRWKGEASFLKFLGRDKRLFLEGYFYDKIEYYESIKKISTSLNTVTSFLVKEDFRDYYYTSGGRFSLGYKFSDDLAFKIGGVFQDEQNAENHAEFSIINRQEPFRDNPEILEGKFNGIRSSVIFKNYHMNLNITAEYTDKKVLRSDFSYKFIKSDFQYFYEPDLSNKFVLTLSGAASSGSLTPQRWIDFGGKIPLEYYGNLRGIGYKYYMGDRMAMGLLEYSLCPYSVWDLKEINSYKDAVRKILKVTLWSGFGWSRLSDRNKALASDKMIPVLTTDGIYREFGFSIGDRFNLLRLDFVYNNNSDKNIHFSFNFMK